MSWRRGWIFLAASVGCAALLVLIVLALLLQQKPSGTTVTMEIGKAPGVVEFPADFGRLGELVPFAGGIAPIPEAVVAVEHGPEFRDAGWVRAQNPDAFTLQVLAVQDEAAVKRFLADREDRAEFVYFLFPQEGTNWYVVTTGSFPTHELAAGVAVSRNFGSLATSPFPRRMSVYQDALKAAVPPAGGAVGE